MKCFNCALIFTLILALLSGCASFDEDRYEYQPQKAVLEKPIADTCYVMPLIDVRPLGQREPAIDINENPYVILVPFWFYSKTELNPLSKHDYFR
ncbi:MAG: hypothetical protein WC637_20225, partial [Victivallales bacterium]